MNGIQRVYIEVTDDFLCFFQNLTREGPGLRPVNRDALPGSLLDHAALAGDEEV